MLRIMIFHGDCAASSGVSWLSTLEQDITDILDLWPRIYACEHFYIVCLHVLLCSNIYYLKDYNIATVMIVVTLHS